MTISFLSGGGERTVPWSEERQRGTGGLTFGENRKEKRGGRRVFLALGKQEGEKERVHKELLKTPTERRKEGLYVISMRQGWPRPSSLCVPRPAGGKRM